MILNLKIEFYRLIFDVLLCLISFNIIHKSK